MKAVGAIGDVVYLESDGNVVEVRNGKATNLGVTVDQWFRFNGGYAAEASDEQVAAAIKAAGGEKTD